MICYFQYPEQGGCPSVTMKIQVQAEEVKGDTCEVIDKHYIIPEVIKDRDVREMAEEGK